MQAPPRPRRRRWPLILAATLIAAAAGWSGLWYYAAATAERTIAGWKSREARAGRVYDCATQTISGFPLRFELRCAGVRAELKSNQPPLSLKTADMLVTARLWQPTVLTTQVHGPLTVADPAEGSVISADWRRAQTEVRGLPTSPERVSIVVEDPVVVRAAGGASLFKASGVTVNGRLLSGTVADHPVIEIGLRLASAEAPSWHEAAAVPVDADITVVLRGLRNFAPKPWPVRLRELQAAGGRIEIVKARVQQGDTVALADGTLGLSGEGRLNGELRLTVANLDQFLPRLGLDRMLEAREQPNKLDKAFGALDRIMPGLGRTARQNAAPMIVAGITLMGEPTEIEGRRAVRLPLRFNDGAVSLGPLLLGYTPALY
jgi:hypothetical protein